MKSIKWVRGKADREKDKKPQSNHHCVVEISISIIDLTALCVLFNNATEQIEPAGNL